MLALAWHLAGGLSRVQVDAGAQPQRMRVGFVTRPADPVVPPPVSLPPAQASVPGGRTPALPAPSDAQALLPATAAVVATPAVPGAPGLFDEDGRPRLPDGRSDRWNRPAAAVPGTVVNAAAGGGTREAVRFGHPSGTLRVGADVKQVDGQWVATKAVMSRSARVLMEGTVRVPRD